jgi:hydrogenase expression/formation protein HypC
MCLAVPGRILEIRDERGTPMATVDFDGIHKEVCLAYLPDAASGDYVIVHVGFALSKVDEASALETLAAMQQLGTLEENLGAEPPAVVHGGTGPGAAPPPRATAGRDA